MPRRPPRRYFWALHFERDDADRSGLSEQGERGLAYARELAEQALVRARSVPESGISDAPLTIEELARRDEVSSVQIRTWIKQARIDLFGRDISDSAIAYRLRKRRERGLRVCAEASCEQTIPGLENGQRRYCEAHSTSAARVRRHRHGSAEVGKRIPRVQAPEPASRP